MNVKPQTKLRRKGVDPATWRKGNVKPRFLPRTPDGGEYPDTPRGWKDRVRHGPHILLPGIVDSEGQQYPIEPDTLLAMPDVAAYLTIITDRPTPYAYSTIKHLRRCGNMPIPTIQEGGREPHPGELIIWKGRAKAAGTGLTPRPGELLDCTKMQWPVWMILEWQCKRPGTGWRGTRAWLVPCLTCGHRTTRHNHTTGHCEEPGCTTPEHVLTTDGKRVYTDTGASRWVHVPEEGAT